MQTPVPLLWKTRSDAGAVGLPELNCALDEARKELGPGVHLKVSNRRPFDQERVPHPNEADGHDSV